MHVLYYLNLAFKKSWSEKKKEDLKFSFFIVVDQSLSHVRLFAPP